MDTTTVLEIIEMLDNSLYELAHHVINDTNQTEAKACMSIGKRQALIDFRDHLQSYIEGQLNAAENETVE